MALSLPLRLTGKAFMKVCECVCGQNVRLERIGGRGYKYVVIKLLKQRSAFPNTLTHKAGDKRGGRMARRFIQFSPYPSIEATNQKKQNIFIKNNNKKKNL
jgi:hypothetical protein